MNSAGDTEEGGAGDHSLPSCSEIANPDTNANLSLVQMDESKGAIPKTKPVKKANNNVEDGLPKRNGFKSYNSVYSDSDSDTESSRGFKRTAASQETYVYGSGLVTNTGADSASCCEASPKETDESSVSDDLGDDNELSISDDGCFYTYKGDQAADLPNSFYHLEIQPMEEPPPGNGREANNSSPEMDFLEMDFDPGPSGDADSDSISNADMDNAENLPLDKVIVPQPSDVSAAKTSFCFPQPRHLLPESSSSGNEVIKERIQILSLISNLVSSPEPKPCHSRQPGLFLPEFPSTSSSSSSSLPAEREPFLAEAATSPPPSSESRLAPAEQPAEVAVAVEEPTHAQLLLRMGSEMDEFYQNCMAKFETLRREMTFSAATLLSAQPWSCTVADRTRPAKVLRTINRHQKGELTSPCDELAAQTGFDGSSKAANKPRSSVRPMIWDEEEAVARQITQVGPSACGATAVLNVLNALGYPMPTVEEVQNGVRTRLRAPGSASLTEYLLSRSAAGCTHRDLIRGIYELSNGGVYSRFFAMHPERTVNLQLWLGYWISLGAVPVATLNLQKCEGPVPDSWHHQMVFGVNAHGVFLTNPLEHVRAAQLFPQLSSEPVLLVRTEDLVHRYNPERDYKELTAVDDVRWDELNVIGQVARAIREHRKRPATATPHIRIPASYSAGITLSIPMDSPTFNLLRQCPELPLLRQECAAGSAL